MSQMFASAEVRWFWCGRCPQEIRDWFFKIGLPPGGGQYRIDRYIVQRSQPTLSIKQRGDELTLEVKGQVTTRRTPELDPLASYLEVWCKWSCAIPGLNFKDQLAVSKTRWRRKFDTSKHVRSEIPLATNERPQRGYSLPIQGCDVELTEVKIVSKSGTWWTLGFEAFGNIDTVSANLTLVLLPDKPFLARTIGSGALMSYPTWLMNETSRVN
jgi:hypothetical protein